MQRASNAFSVLQAIAAVVSLSIILWSLGLPSFRFAEAANVTTVSNTLSDSAPGVVSNHTIVFTTPTGVANNTSITLDFSDGPFVLGSVDFTDVDIATSSGDYTVGDAGCSGGYQVAVDVSSWPTMSLEFCNGETGSSIPANGTTTIQIGTNATGGDAQLTNPAVGTYEIGITAGTDTGATRVAIVSTVTVTASVDTFFEFTVAGVQGNQLVNGTTTGATTTPTEIKFGKLDTYTASTAAQDLSVVTNARNGFTVTVQADSQLSSVTGADIDSFANGGNQTTPIAWTPPSPTVGFEDTYGHWGITSDDTDYFAATETYVAASTTPVEIFTHNAPVDGTVTGQGTTRVGYTVEVSPLQEAATDYQATLTYVATPVF